MPDPFKRSSTYKQMNRGKLAILLMVALACVLGLISVGYHRWASHGVLAWWGGDMARLIADAPQVEALRLQQAATTESARPADTLLIGGKRYAMLERKDVTAAIGLDHLRRALLDDANFVWPAQPAASAENWSDALVFADRERRLIVVFDFARHRVGRPDAATTLAIDQTDRIASGWEDFFAEEFPRAKKR